MKFLSPGIPRTLTLACIAAFALAACSKTPEAAAPANAPVAVATTPPVSTTVGTEIDDSVVTTRIKSALLADQEVKSFDIKVETRKGQVQLSGFVDNQSRIDHAVALVARIEGVKGIDNAMSIKDGKATVGNAVDDSIVTAKVKSALLTDAMVSSNDISVATRKGEVQLSGFVSNQAQIDRAVTIARAVEGVREINNEMTIKK